MNSYPHNYFLNFSISQVTVAASTTKLYPDFSSGNNVDLDMKEIGHRRIPSRDFSNSHFSPAFYCASDFIAFYEKYACKITAPIPSLDQYVLM